MINRSWSNFDEVVTWEYQELGLDMPMQLEIMDHGHFFFLNQGISIEDDVIEHVVPVMDIESIIRMIKMIRNYQQIRFINKPLPIVLDPLIKFLKCTLQEEYHLHWVESLFHFHLMIQ